MNKLSKRVLSLLLALLMVLGTCDQALAAGLDNGRYENDNVIELPENPEPTEKPDEPDPTKLPENPEPTELPENPEPTELPENPEPTELPENPEPTELPENPEPTEKPVVEVKEAVDVAYSDKSEGEYTVAVAEGSYSSDEDAPELKSVSVTPVEGRTVLEGWTISGNGKDLKLTVSIKTMPTLEEGETLALVALNGSVQSSQLKVVTGEGDFASVTVSDSTTGIALVKVAASAAEETPAEKPIKTEEQTMPAGNVSINGFLPVGGSVTAVKQGAAKPQMVFKSVNRAASTQSTTSAPAANEKVLASYDITILDESGKSWQPEKPVTVTITDDSFGDGKTLQIYHQGSSGREFVATVTSHDKSVSFPAEHFSVYVVVEIVTPRVAVKFYDDDGETLLDTMYVKKTDTESDIQQIVYDPSSKVVLGDKEVFYGWANAKATSADASKTAKSIDTIRTEVKTKASGLTDADAELNYYAVVCKSYFVDYLGDQNVVLGSGEVRFLPSEGNSQSYTVNQVYTPADDLHNFEGWLVSEGSSNIADYTTGKIYENGTEIRITGDVIFSVNAPSGQWLVYDENAPEGSKATYNAPRFLKTNDKTVDPNTPERPMVCVGYEFGGWFDTKEHADDPTYTTRFVFGNTISDKTTVYARWTPKTKANYTIIIWKQSVNGADENNNKLYDFVETITVSDKDVGSPISIVSGTSGNKNATVNGANKGYDGFHYQSNDQAEVIDGKQKAVEADGSTVVNVYFDRNEHTLTFQAPTRVNNPSGSDTELYGYVDGLGYVHLSYHDFGWMSGGRAWGFQYQGSWHHYSNYGDGYYYHYTTVKTITALYQQDISSNFPITSGGTSYAGYVWEPQNSQVYTTGDVPSLETMPDEDTVFHAKTYSSSPSTKAHMYYYVESLPGTTGDVNIDGVNYDLRQDVQIYIDESVTSTRTEDFIPIAGFTQDFSDPVYGSDGKVELNYDNNYTIKFYYSRNSYKLSYFDGVYVTNEGTPVNHTPRTGALKEETGIAYNSSMAAYNKGGAKFYNPDEVEGFVFEGWYLDSACVKPCTFTTMPENGMRVYAKWVQKEYRVFMHPNAVLDNGEKDTTLTWGGNVKTSFKDAEGAKVSLPQGLRDEYELVGWFSDTAFKHPVSDKIALTAETTTDYAQTEDTELDKWGNSTQPGYNKDAAENRFWVVGKMELYARWRKVLEGAEGIGLVYSGNGLDNEGKAVEGTAGSDTHKYKDHAAATAITAAEAEDSTKYRFDYWVVQKWNEAAGKYEDTDVHVYAGAAFDVLKDDAKVVVTEWVNPNDPTDTRPTKDATHTKISKATYTVQLRAQYVKVEEHTPTHIYWYSNYGSDNGGKGTLYRSDEKLKINEAVDILGAQTREGYTFKGWTKTQGGTTADFLVWTGSAYTDADGNAATQVAADENKPYDDLFAVWEENKVTINYAVASDSTGKGTVDPTTETIKAATGTAAGSTATASSSTYIIDYWTCDDGTVHVGDEATFVPSKNANDVYEAHTYYAHFKLNQAPVTVHHYLKGTTTKVANDVTEDKTIGTEYTANAATTFLEAFSAYSLKVSGDATQTVTVSVNGNEITFYYVIELTIKAADKSAVYDGSTTLTGEFTISGELTDDSAKILTALGTPPTIGPDVATEEYTAVTTGVPSYYTISESSDLTGKLTITKAAADELGLSVTNYNAPYDGAAHTVTATTTVTEGTTISYSTDNTNWSTTAPMWTDVTEAQTVYVKAENPNYETATASGTVTITALEITVNDTATETYDGTTKTLTIAASKATGVLSGETLTLTGATISGIDQGEYTEVAAYTWSVAKADGSDSTGNYTITVTGKLTITRREVTVSVADKTVPYNGSEQSGNTATTFANVVDGQTATIGYTPSKGTLVDTYDNGVYADDFKVVDGDGNDVTANYTLGTQTKGKLTITDEDIPDDKYATKSTGDEDGKKYHIGDTVTWTIEVTNIYNETKTVTVTEAEGMTIVSPDPMPTELAAGEKLVIKVEHVVTLDDVKAGKIENTAKVELGNKLKPEPTDEVETEKIKITVTAASQTKQYDGTALTNGTFTVTPADPEVPVAKGDTVTATVTGSQTQVGSSANTLSNVKVTNTVIEKDAEGKEVEVVTDVTAAYEITTVNGTLTVTAPPPVPYRVTYVFAWPGGGAPAGAPAVPTVPAPVLSGSSYTVGGDTTTNFRNNYPDIPYGIAPNGNVITVLRFQGWDRTGTINNIQSDVTITGTWTIQMVWYTVTYTDGVPGQVIFPDQVTTTLRIGANTPAFNGTPTREGYTFTGWAPAVSPTVTGNNVYTAQWTPIEEEEETVEPTPEPTPVVEEEIIDEEVPQAAPAAAWALINLLAALGTVATAVGMIITFFKKKDDDDDGTKANPDEENDENKGKKSKFLGLIPAVASVVIFILTENMHNPMALVDKWTIPMVLILAANGIVAYLTRNKKPEDEDTEKAAG